MVKLTPEHAPLVDAAILKKSYYEFVKYMWDTTSAEVPHWNWHIKYTCARIQEKCERLFLRLPSEGILIANMPPGQTKSTIFSVMLRGWLWTRFPQCQMIFCSHNASLTDELSQKARDVVQSEKYQKLFPHIKLRGDQNAVRKWMNTLGGWSYSCPVGSSPVGRHAHVIVVDDAIDPTAAGREQSEKITTANRFMSETLPSRLIPNDNSAFLMLVMQRLAQNDPTGYALERYEGTNRIQLVRLPAEDSDQVHPPELRVMYRKNDGLLNPKNLTRELLAEKELDLGGFGYAGQYKQNPISRSGNLFDVSTFSTRIVQNLPIGIVFDEVMRYWDLAISEKKEGCYTVGALLARQTLRDGLPIYWVLDIVRGKWGSHERSNVVIDTSEEDRERFKNARRGYVVGFEREGGSGGIKVIDDFSRMLGSFKVYEDKVSGKGDKTLRAEPFSRMVNRGVVYLLKGGWNREYIEELKYFPKSKFLDQTDASAGAYNYLSTPRPEIFVMSGNS